MKKTIKFLICSLLVLVLFNGCDADGLNDGRFNENPQTGWVDFNASTDETTISGGQATLDVPVQINVPSYPNGFNISYQLEGVAGDFTPFVTATTGSVFADPNAPNATDRIANIVITFQNLDQERLIVNSFDVVLTATDDSNVRVGVDANSTSSSTRYRVNIPCSNPDVLPADFFVGDYAIADVNANLGPANGTENFGAGTVTLTVDPTNPNRRLFSAAVLPAFTGGAPVPVSLEFSPDDYVTLGGYVGTGIGCGGGIEFGYDAALPADSTPWDICNDNSITIIYTEDAISSCGGPFAGSSFSLTKL
ncbi:hypothetical protein [Winogradskyella sp. 3972H.M.0a.05]|uniref:hypothetical protein n=1 Tax=Winogradskyella sp. 3972H.M.0a.05 TaxID=2950277 RepID=UPI003391BDAC